MHILHQLQIAENVFHLGPVVERESADHVVLDLISTERFFYKARLRVRSVQHGTTRRLLLRARLAQILLHAIGDKESLILAIRRLIVADQRATLAGRPEVFPLAL